MKNTGHILILGSVFLLFMGGFIAFMNPANPLVGLPTAVIGLLAFSIGIIYLFKERDEQKGNDDHLVLRDLEEEKTAVLLNDEDQYV